ncbi:vWA domain-containing protein [Tunicatimonas pelagia]|uniref:vWA domain-containing protein n=1 Tax=Tunicatimonas pelagia TaxID=931531 RepID=UPI002665F336|nr:VWA domain-containing protein [Tunicatimonas pelagia]WKN45264.1 VWA domain-containing protein [Tunicatimonas pelagia]
MRNLIILLAVATVCASCYEDHSDLIPDPEVLPGAMNLLASDDKALTIDLTWDEVPGADSYKVFRRDYFAVEDSMLEVGESDVTFYTNLDVESSTSYEYYVAAFNGVLGIPSDTVVGSTRRITTEETFDVLAEFTDGESYESSGAYQLGEVILTVIGEQAQASADLVFLIDNTGSMSDDIYYIQVNLNAIIDALPTGVRVGVAEYGDNNVDPTNWYESTPLTSDLASIKDYINAIQVSSGGDTPESVYDGLYRTIDEMNWSSSVKKMIIVIGDAPPLEGFYSNYTLKEVVEKANEVDIVANLYPILVY